MQNTLEEMLNFAHNLAWQAGKITLRYFQTNLLTEVKSDNSPVTVADRETERFIREAISKRYPDHAVLGEEDGGTGNSQARWRWIIDPLDGTRSFVRGFPLYGVMIGVEYEGEPMLGVVNMPALNEVVYAAKDLGCWWNGRRCWVSEKKTIADGLFVATRANNYERYGVGKQAAFDRLLAQAGMFRTWGDCYGYLLVATGRAELMLDPEMRIWDAAALLPILHEAGGTFTDWHGIPTIDGGEGLGTNGHVRDEVLKLLGL
jgi:histidinol phosphatase-like enzyme (inositol monophosphatase family)